MWKGKLHFSLVNYEVVSNNGLLFYWWFFFCMIKIPDSNKIIIYFSLFFFFIKNCVVYLFISYFQDKFLNMIGGKHQNFEFLRTLSSKCSYNIFSAAHVCCILDDLSGNSPGKTNLEASSVRLLLVRRFFSICFA